MADTPVQDRKLGLPRQRDGKRFYTKYDPELALNIILRIAEGETLKSICTLENEMPAMQTFYRWLRLHPKLREAYEAAKEVSAFAFEDEAIDKARSTAKNPIDSDNISASRLLIDQLRWSAARRNPKHFADRSNQPLIIPVNIQSSLDLGEQAKIINHDDNVYELSYNPLEEEPKPKEKRYLKQQLTPRIAEGEDYKRPAYSEAKERKLERDKEYRKNVRKEDGAE